jgi:hypothetical protein
MSKKIFGFHISHELAARLQTLLDKVEAASDKRPFAMELFGIIEELADTGLAYFFIKPLKKAKIGGLTIKAVEIAMNMGKSAVLKIGKGVIKGMDNTQLAVVIEMLEQSLTQQIAKNAPDKTDPNTDENKENNNEKKDV